jgi:carboxyl-terminal processing protease
VKTNSIRYAAALSAALGMLVGAIPVCRGQTPATNGSPAVTAPAADNVYKQLELLAEIMLLVKRHYCEPRTYEALVHGAIQGLLQSLDPHSAFMEEDEFQGMRDDTSGSFGGIGIQISLKDGMLVIIAPIEDSPAFRAGLQSGDRILAVDGERIVGISLKDAVGKLRGEIGSQVVLTVIGDGDKDSRDVTVIRDEIDLPSVKGACLLHDGVAYVRVTQFAIPTAELLVGELRKLDAAGMNALVLDLRANPGGLLNSAAEVAQLFLERKALIVTTRGREGGGQEQERRAAGGTRYLDLPMAVLINGGSASAAEIVAGALQDHHRAVLIGETSFGKGSVQSVIESRMFRGTAIRLTTAHYYTPGGRLIHELGIEPDIPLYLTPEEWRRVQINRAHRENPAVYSAAERADYADVVDRQLQRAVDLLQAVKVFRAR